MKRPNSIVVAAVAAVCLAGGPAHAEVLLPADGDREKWHEFIDMFAECSAVYNIAATIKSGPGQPVTGSYRELANNALISGMLSAEKSGLNEDYLESIYSVKLGLWQHTVKVPAQRDQLFVKADYCITTALPYQSAIIATLRNNPASH